jgi:hypothetical protein
LRLSSENEGPCAAHDQKRYCEVSPADSFETRDDHARKTEIADYGMLGIAPT